MGSLRLTFRTGAVVAGVLTPVAYPLTLPVTVAYAGDTAAVSVAPSPPAPGSDIRLSVEGCEQETGTAASEAFVADALLTRGSGPLVGETRVRSSLKPGTYGVRVTCDGREDKVEGRIEVARKAGAAAAAAGKDQAGSDETGRGQADGDEAGRGQADGRESDGRESDRHESGRGESDGRESDRHEPGSGETGRDEAGRDEAGKDENRRPAHPPATDAPPTHAAPPEPPAHASPVAPVRAGGGGTAHLSAEARDDGPGLRHAVIGIVLAGVAAIVVLVRSTRRGRGTE